MALGYAQISIAGEDAESGGVDCKALILDGGKFKPQTIGQNTFAADGTVITQLATISKGVAFGIKFEFIPPNVLNSILSAIETALSGAGNFNVTATDDLHSINENCVPDFAAGFVEYPEQRTSDITIKSVILRFITV